ncbi:efflux RND transporter periplasmic adaptor subunit [Aetokthonos hydrillicola Thurmond2011]|jgi:RND family efflux transporter MFP subunit|uniref:Efflux RND transporter periplasmic adaptor subunit n=1 Tax=Aetokthonos hydrillicola Thurmond2011 TaxID=2712845 RepID=A0AAP5MB62_9CYAN|nr:efflux RND transporter periplasmic adaptor subunit [Aetokthonos hydrillicola]MBO3464008.1 efflux RND transporter periplasmic adaptor subunit [Aetokthonos hydrillicola CCALA 1050]MBW4584471.1 efflux RND transporter periplasmic adaptor subunit [Aetokthonos hydrillicola CCALA 1050]MDR9896434.1 efflux RND transporter periplasmic adaptor subunit [Aetokthonos hydrillicola Thurmond2011]
MKNYLLLSTVLLVSILTTSCNKAGESAKANTPPPTTVKIATLQNGQLQDTSQYVGTLQAERTVDLKPEIQGRIEKILVQPGARVKQGDAIVILNPEQALPQYNSAQAAVAAAIAARNTAAKNLQASIAQLSQSQSQYQLAKINNTRYQYLAQQGAVDRATADNYATNLKVQQGVVRTNQNQIAANRAALTQAEANVRQAQANAAAAQVNVNFKRVAAPIDGFVGNINLKIGDYVNTGDTLTTINQNNAFDLQIPIPISRSNELKTGLPVQLLDPNTNAVLGSGNIYFVSSQADSNAQSIITRARFLNKGGNLRDGQYVKASVIWNTKQGVLVPVNAVTTIGGQSFVFVAKQNQVNGKNQLVARQVPVTLGDIQGQQYQIEKGLKPGDEVITSGILKLRDGVPIVSNANNAANNAQSQS